MTVTTPEIIRLESGREGKNVLVLGAIHGNETCGPIAIRRILKLIAEGDIVLKKGTLTFVPVCNPLAYEQNKRFIDTNLNRHFYPKDNPQGSEEKLHNILCPVIAQCDVLLDLHSFTAEGEAFVSLSSLRTVAREIEIARHLGVPRFICGWADALENSEDVEDKKRSQGTTELARSHGHDAITMECGRHDDPRAPLIAFNAILHLLKHFDMADFPESLFELPETVADSFIIKMKGAFLKKREGDYVQSWKNMDFVKAGTVIAKYEDGEKLIVPEDGFIILPKRDAEITHEWFFWGAEENSIMFDSV